MRCGVNNIHVHSFVKRRNYSGYYLLYMGYSAAESNYHRGILHTQSWLSLPITFLNLGCHNNSALGI
jgi:hypothetical protein